MMTSRTLGVVVFGSVMLVGCAADLPTAPAATPATTPGSLSVTASPTVVLTTGSTAQVTVVVNSPSGQRVPGARVGFSVSSGTIEPSEQTTDPSGMASASVTASSSTTVTVRVDDRTQQITLPAVPAFSVSLIGESPAYTDRWGLTVNVVPNRDVVAPPQPARVVIDCGAGSPTTMPGFIGTSGLTCVFGQPGDYIVSVSAVAANGWTTQQTMRVSAGLRPGPTVPPEPPVPAGFLTLDASEVTRGTTYAEWRFNANTNGRVTTWDFGDGSGGNNDRRNEQHIYRTAGVYVVSVRAIPPDHSTEMSATRTITVVFP